MPIRETEDVVERLGTARVLPVATFENKHQAEAVARALMRGGLGVSGGHVADGVGLRSTP